MKKYQIVEIEWLDSMAASGWQRTVDIVSSPLEGMAHKTLGYFFTENKRSILVVQSRRNDLEFLDGVFEIPKGCIIKIKKL